MFKRLNMKGLIQIKSLTKMNILIVYWLLFICCFQLQNVLKTINLKAKILFTTLFVRSRANTRKLSASVRSISNRGQGTVRVVSRERTCRKLYFHMWLVGWLCSWTDRPQMWRYILGTPTALRRDGSSVYRLFYETSKVLRCLNYSE